MFDRCKALKSVFADLSRFPREAEAEVPHPEGALRATFLGVSTVLLDDGEHAVLTDGFFSRPGILRVLAGRIGPDQRRIDQVLERPGFDHLDVVAVTHSHFDHALDSTAVAEQTGAHLLGSESTRQIAQGNHFPSDRFLLARDAEAHRFGDFEVTMIESAHSPGDAFPGVIDAPLQTPATSRAFKTGDTYSVLVAHRGRRVLIHGSAGFVPGALDGHSADTIYLGVGVLGKQSEKYREEYWNEVVVATGARRIVPVHWDNFTRPLSRPLRPVPRPADEIDTALSWLQARSEREGIEFELPRAGVPVNPWPRGVGE